MIHSIEWKIVLIDDEEDIRQVLSIVLSDAGHIVSTAEDGKSGIELCEEISPQIVITDIRMPGMDGIKVLEILKKQSPEIEVIVLTAFGEMKQAAKALQLDASDYINKPISDEVLFIALKRAQNRYLSRQRMTSVKENPLSSSFPKKIIEGSIEGALVCDEKERIISINNTLLQILGYRKDKIINKMTICDIFSTLEKERLYRELKNEQAGWEKRISLFETTIFDKDGRGIPVQMSITLLTENGQKKGMVCFFKDLREQKLLCDQWVFLLDQINIGAFTIDINRHITSFNESVQTMTGLKESEVLGKDCREIFSDIQCHSRCPFRVEGNCDEKDLSVEIKDANDNVHMLTRLSAPLYGAENRVTGCLTVLQDHAALADLINRVNYKERSLKTILDNIDIGIFTVNRGGYTTFFNSAAEVISGYNRKDVLGRPCSAIYGNSDSIEPRLVKESMTLGEARSNSDCEIITSLGEIVPIQADYIPLHSDHGKIIGCIATIQDLTLSQQFKQVLSNRYTFHSMIGKEPIMQKIFETVQVVSKSDVTILIEGATGTGKDLLAKVIHSSSSRANKPFVKVNCAALPENLLESELFGYLKGAFTGADKNKPGRFQEADKGTIFLDEIGDLPLSLQAKFLRVLEDKEFYPLGSRKTVKVDVRIISATNRDLRKLVKKRVFRQDLYYRLNVMPIELPPLCKRRDDIPLIIRHIIRKLCSTRPVSSSHQISKEAMKMLLDYDYPGNIRELQNFLEHAIIVCQGNMIEPEHLPISLRNHYLGITDGIIKEEKFQLVNNDVRERDTILHVLRSNHWNKTKSAKDLGIDRTTLWRKIKSFDIRPT
jgi:PAS domain S-box-containing protein